MRLLKLSIFVLLNCLAALVKAQTACPDNINFMKGDFTNWKCSTGTVDPSGIVSFDGFVPVTGRQTLAINTYTGVDPYGNFPVVAPNGSKYSLQLGNSSGNHEAEQVSYTFTIPADKPDYIFTYYYAVVLQLTSHKDFERPRFRVVLTDVTTNEVIPCGTHDFISGDGLGSFQKAPGADSVEFRDWSTVAVELAGKAGHTVRFDFTTNDCVYVKHFGYAYLAFDDPCVLNSDPITGTKYCRGVNSVTLKAPPGFDQYIWKQVGSNVVVGNSQLLTLTPVPADGTKFTVDAESFTGVGQGCPASFATTVHKVDEDLVFKVLTSVKVCEATGVDLTAPEITAGSGADLTFKYYADANQQVVVRDPTAIHASGTYYIKGTNAAGCEDILPIQLELVPDPVVRVTNPVAACIPATIDLTDPQIVGGYNPNLKYEYYRDIQMTILEPNPKRLTDGGIYYIKVINSTGCSIQASVLVTLDKTPYIKPQEVSGCAPFDITSIDKSADTPGLLYSYFTDAAATIPLAKPDSIVTSNTYYELGITTNKCVVPTVIPIKVNIYSPAVLNITPPAPVSYPLTIDINNAFAVMAGYTYSFYTDSAATTRLVNYKTVNTTGKYFIKAVNATGCQIIKAATLTVNPPENAGLDTKNTFTPNGDGINDEFKPVLLGAPQVKYLKIYNRNGSMVFETKDVSQYWNGTFNGSPLPTGTYYWVFSCYDLFYKHDVVKSGSVTIIR